MIGTLASLATLTLHPRRRHSGAPRSCVASPESITTGGTNTERPGLWIPGSRAEPAPRNDSAHGSKLKIDELRTYQPEFADRTYRQSPTCSPSMETLELTNSRPPMAPFDMIVAV